MARTLVVGVLALGLAVGAAVAVSASVDSGSADAPPTAFGGGQPGGGDDADGFRDGPAAAGGLAADALHGEFVVSDGSGGYQTIRTQTGEVTEIGADSLTVESADGFTATYSVDDLLPGLSVGDTVSVTATVSGDTATVTSLIAGDRTGSQDFGPPGDTAPGQDGAPRDAPQGPQDRRGRLPGQDDLPQQENMPAPVPSAMPMPGPDRAPAEPGPGMPGRPGTGPDTDSGTRPGMRPDAGAGGESDARSDTV